jgi:hypothetical protein
VLWCFAFAKPLFDVLADSPEFFVARGNTRGDILIFSFALLLLVPTVMVLIEAAFVRLPVVRRTLHLVFVGVLAATLALQIADDALGASSAVLIAIAVAVGAAFAVVYARARFLPSMLTLLGPLPAVFLVWFLLFSPVSDLILPQDVEEAATAKVTSRTPVVFVVFDEFDPNMLMDAREQIDATRYPGFAQLARDGTWYRSATTTNSATTLAVPSALSGRHAPRDSLPTQADFPNSIFTLLGDRYEFHVEELATELCPERLCGSRVRGSTRSRLQSLVEDLGVVSLHLLLPQGLRSGLPAVDRTFGSFQTSGRDDGGSRGSRSLGPPPESVLNRAAAAERLLDGIQPTGERPSFSFAHLVLPHVPWEYLPTGQQYPPNEGDIRGLQEEHWDPNPVFARLGLQRHLLQTGYADKLIRQLIDRLRDAGVYDRALVVVTADHGVSYRAGQPRRAPTPETLSDVAAVPLFIKYPGQRHGKTDDTMVRTIDIVPTIADALQVRLPYEADGKAIRSGRDMSATVSVDSAREAPVTEPFAEFVKDRQAGLRRILSLFGSDDGGRGLYASGPGRELLGRSTATLVTDSDHSARVDFSDSQAFGTVRPSAPVIPTLFSGRITGPVKPGTSVAVAVNGRVRGVSETFDDGGETRLAVMVPPSSFKAGRNRIEVMTIDRIGPRPHVTALDVTRAADYRLVERDGAQVLLGGDTEVPVEGGNVDGAIDDLKQDGESIRIGGWAASRAAERPATRVLVFAGDRLVAQGTPDSIRADIVRKWKTFDVAKSGYRFRVSGVGVDPDDIRVIGLYRGKASQLPVYGG